MPHDDLGRGGGGGGVPFVSMHLESTLPSIHGMINRVLFYSPVHLRSRHKREAQMPSSQSRLLPVLARATTVRFGRDVKASAQNDPGLPVMDKCQQQVGKSVQGATAGSATKGERLPALHH